VSPFEILVSEALRVSTWRDSDHDPQLVGGEELALDAALSALDCTRAQTQRHDASYMTGEVIGPSQPSLDSWARHLELVPATWNGIGGIKRVGDRPRRLADGREVEPRAPVDRDLQVAGVRLHIDELDPKGQEHRRDDTFDGFRGAHVPCSFPRSRP
jgi:hypothetical protein